MKTRTSDREVATSGLLETGSFKILANGKAFKVLIDGLYANKIKAVIRELCSNAFDSHAAAGCKDKPFIVQLPTVLDPTFRVRDFGTSLPHDDVMGLYTTVFQSSKENTNTQVGKLGLGSKSPFAYVDAFTVTTYLGGERRVYGAYIGEDGVPAIALMETGSTAEEDGLEVSFPAQTKDVTAFKENALVVLKYFDVKPTILGQKLAFEEEKPVLAGKGWKLFTTYAYRDAVSVARQGVVAYPLDASAIPNLSPVEKQLLACKIYIDFPIGSLEIAASREALSYDKPTVTNIQRRLKEIEQEIVSKYVTEILAQDTYWKACVVYNRTVNNNSVPEIIRQAIKSGAKFQGREVTHSLSVPEIWLKLNPKNDTVPYEVHYLDGYVTGRKRLEFSVRTSASHRHNHYGYNRGVSAVDDTLFYVTIGDRPHQEAARIRSDHQNRNGHALILIRAEDQATADKILAEFGNPPYKLTSGLPEIPKPTRSNGQAAGSGRTTKDQIKAKKVTFGFGDMPAIEQKAEIVDLTIGAYYVTVTDNKFTYNDRKVDQYSTNDLMSALKEAAALGYISQKDQIYVVSGVYVDRVRDRTGWVELCSFLDAKLKADAQRYIDANERSSKFWAFSYNRAGSLATDRLKVADPNSPMARLVAIHETVGRTHDADRRLWERVQRVSSFLKEARNIRDTKSSAAGKSEVQQLCNEAERRYPMLSYIESYSLNKAKSALVQYIDMVDRDYKRINTQTLKNAA